MTLPSPKGGGRNTGSRVWQTHHFQSHPVTISVRKTMLYGGYLELLALGQSQGCRDSSFFCCKRRAGLVLRVDTRLLIDARITSFITCYSSSLA
jgi:hypothetical protein